MSSLSDVKTNIDNHIAVINQYNLDISKTIQERNLKLNNTAKVLSTINAKVENLSRTINARIRSAIESGNKENLDYLIKTSEELMKLKNSSKEIYDLVNNAAANEDSSKIDQEVSNINQGLEVVERMLASDLPDETSMALQDEQSRQQQLRILPQQPPIEQVTDNTDPFAGGKRKSKRKSGRKSKKSLNKKGGYTYRKSPTRKLVTKLRSKSKKRKSKKR